MAFVLRICLHTDSFVSGEIKETELKKNLGTKKLLHNINELFFHSSRVIMIQ